MDEKKFTRLMQAIEGVSAELQEIKSEIKALTERNIRQHEELSTRIMILSEMFIQHDMDYNNIKTIQ